MLERVAEHLHEFTASTASSFAPSLRASSTNTTFAHHHYITPSQQPTFMHTLHQTSKINHQHIEDTRMASMNFEIESHRSIRKPFDPWSNDEILALLKIRSSLENWFPDSTWEHVSRKLAEIGFKRSAESCKEKFEEESRYFNNINYFHSNYRVFNELEELYNHGDKRQGSQEPVVSEEMNRTTNKTCQEHEHQDEEGGGDSRIDRTVRNEDKEGERSKNKKRKSEEKFEMFKGFCEDIIRKMMARQEEMHNKLVEDMVRKDEEKIAREEAWKRQEMDRINKELQIRGQEQALAGDRQTIIINFLKKFLSSGCSSEINVKHVSGDDVLKKVPNSSNSSSSSSLVVPNPNLTFQSPIDDQTKHEAYVSTTIASSDQNSSPLPIEQNRTQPSSILQENHQPIPNPSESSCAQNLNCQSNGLVPNSLANETVQKKPSMSKKDKDEIGKRWPKDEVIALIKLRCNLCNSNEDHKETTSVKAPLWERVSQGMLELGYKRSSKRCKEKWENINKYFRKTKEVNKKRSVDSRTCPYFHLLSTLYDKGTPPISSPESRPERQSPEKKLVSSLNDGQSSNGTMHGGEGEQKLVHAQGF